MIAVIAKIPLKDGSIDEFTAGFEEIAKRVATVTTSSEYRYPPVPVDRALRRRAACDGRSHGGDRRSAAGAIFHRR